jgi:hypothetical protein
MTAMTIKDVCPAERVDEVAVQTRDAWIKTRKLHPLLTGEDDMALMALMCTAGMDADAAAERAEAIFGHMVDKGIPKSAAQSCAMVLSLYDRPVDEMVAKMCDLYQALKEAKHATSRLRDESMAIYAAFTDVEAPTETLVTEIGEVDTWLRRQRGYGPMGVGGNVRRLIAAAMVLRDYETENATSASIAINAASAVTQAIIEQVVFTVMLLILVSVISSTTSSSH